MVTVGRHDVIPALAKYRSAPPAGFTADVLLHFDGANGSTSFPDVGSSGATWTVSSGVPALSTADAILGSAALRMANGGDGVSSAAWPAGLSLAGEFTITFKWKYLGGSMARPLILTSFSGAGGDQILVIFLDNGVWAFYTGIYGSSDTQYEFPDLQGFQSGTSYEIAFTRDASGNFGFAINGNCSIHGQTASHQNWTHMSPIVLGANSLGASYAVGVIDELMIIDKSLFGANYVTHAVEYVQGSIVAFAAQAAQSSALLLHFEGAVLTDANPNPLIFNIGSCTLSATQAKFGTQSLFMNGGYSFGTNAKTIINAHDFTVDFWAYTTSVGSLGFFTDSRQDGTNTSGFAIFVQGGLLAFSDGAVSMFGPAMPLNAWHHVEVCRSGTTVYLFLDGVIVATGTYGNNFLSAGWVLGAAQYSPIGAAPIFGYMDEFHIVNGTALHTANFTPPTAPYTP